MCKTRLLTLAACGLFAFTALHAPAQESAKPAGKAAPTLSGATVTPTSGDTTTDFYWLVKYFDADGDPPASADIYIDSEAKHTMLLYSGTSSDGTYRYGPRQLAVGTHAYYFDFSDGQGGSDRDPDTGTHTGPTVVLPNTPPALSGAAVTPTTGTVTTSFYWLVGYFDADGNAPATMDLHIDSETPVAMALFSGTASNGTYRYGPRTMSVGAHSYFFDCADGQGGTDREPDTGAFNGPLVIVPNTPPVLSNAAVLPPSGTTLTNFYWYVRYFDADGDAPATKTLQIDAETPVGMTLFSGTAANGTYRYGPRTLPIGTHSYFFNFADGQGGSDRDPDTGAYSGPVVSSSNQAPQLSAAQVSPAAGTPLTSFFYLVRYYDADGDSPATKNLYIDSETPVAMTLFSGTAANGTYRYGPRSHTVGTHTYYFNFTDGQGGTDRDPNAGAYTGPVVSAVNNPPQLSSPAVTPVSGDTSTGFYWLVRYFDQDGNAPALKDLYIDSESPVAMTLFSGTASDGTYRYGPRNLALGTHAYYFAFADGQGGSDREPDTDAHTGPVVSAVNNPPQLSAASVRPSNGTISTNFYWWVTYFDADGDAPAQKNLLIDSETPVAMTLFSGTAANGTYRYGPRQLAEGVHSYFFDFIDARGATDRDPDAGAHSGPVVSSTQPVSQMLRVNSWNLTLKQAKAAGDSMQMAGEFNSDPDPSGSPVVPANDGILYHFGPGPLVSEVFSPSGFGQPVRGKVPYRDQTRNGSFLLNIGGGSRSKFSFKSSGAYGPLRGETSVPIAMESGPFADDVEIEALLKGKPPTAGNTGSTFSMTRAPYVSEELFVDSLLVKKKTSSANADTLRLTARFPGAPTVNPYADIFAIDLGWMSIEVLPGTWTISKTGTALTIEGSLGGGSQYTLKVDNAKRTISLSCSRMDASAAAPAAMVDVGFGAFRATNYLFLEERTSSGQTQLIY